MEHDHLQITLIDPGRSLEELMPVALTNRPELASRRALVKAAEVAVRREKARTFLPSVYLTGFQTPGGMLIQGGVFGLGPNSSLSQWTGRDDVSVQLMWQLESFGIGNLARIKKQRGQQSQAIVDLVRGPGHGRGGRDPGPRARAVGGRPGPPGRSRLAHGSSSPSTGRSRAWGRPSRFGNVLVLINRPQEAVYALQLLQVAFDEYFTTVAEYNRAQFDLFHALGYPAQEVTSLRTPGEVLPVDTARPRFLPPVGNGPPPATR